MITTLRDKLPHMYDKIIIVAHTDDELLWAWKDLLNEKDWLVICIFQQYNYHGADRERRERLKRFQKISNVLEFKHIILSYQDNPYQLEVNPETQHKIKRDITPYITPNIKKILTHNPDGEYGHYHHKITSKIVTELVDDKEKLYYFSFDQTNKNTEFPEIYNICFNIYFNDKLDDVTVIGHKNLSKICNTVNCLHYTTYPITDYYPSSLLNSDLITFNEYI